MDFLEEKLSADRFVKLRKERPKWKFTSLGDLREHYPEYQLIQACRDVGMVGRGEMKALHGLLNKRNECAHPSSYYPNLNETLGYISELIGRIETIQPRHF